MISQLGLSITVQTPERITDIDLHHLAEDQGAPIVVISDIEGTLTPWGRPEIPGDVKDWLAGGFNTATLRALVTITNKGGRGGAELIKKVREQVHDLQPQRYNGFWGTELRPNKRSERKPSGHLGKLAMNKILYQNIMAEEVIFVGDKPSDMKEADILHRNYGIFMGFMVARLGNSDHPLDIAFGKRRAANKYREQIRQANPDQAYVLARSST